MKITLKRSDLILLKEKDLPEQIALSGWHEFVDSKNQFISWGYLGKQNKGYGWLVKGLKEFPNETFLVSLFEKAFQKRITLINDSNTTAFRLFNGPGDGLGGITIDLYGDYSVISYYNETIYELKNLIEGSLKKAYELVFKKKLLGLVEKNRYGGNWPESQLVEGDLPESFLIKENGLNYRVYLNEGLMTGIFLDQRKVRESLLKKYGKNKRVLNTFSYTGAFSVPCIAAGAKETTSVDLAKRSRKKTEEQFLANEFDLSREKIYVMDIFAYFSYAQKKGLGYDLIILDPPSFARNKKKTFSAKKDYHELITQSLQLMNQGYLLCSTNASNVSYQEFKDMISDTFKKNHRQFSIEEVFRLPEDFPYPESLKEENYLKVLLVKVLP